VDRRPVDDSLPPIGAGPADVVPVRIDPEPRTAIGAHAKADYRLFRNEWGSGVKAKGAGIHR
jgi:hypothetical protein